jgi:hypothetical protein
MTFLRVSMVDGTIRSIRLGIAYERDQDVQPAMLHMISLATGVSPKIQKSIQI